MRYDVEVSGFPSSHCGHVCLLRLKEDDYPGTTVIEEWPSWTQPVLAWAKGQGAVVGYAHSGHGLQLPDYMPNGKREFAKSGRISEGWPGRAADTLPDYAMPRFDGIGANEYIVTSPNGVCDFISSADTPPIWELNIWYHTLNCGLRSRISGETDFPCIYGDRVGMGRVYVKMRPDERFDYDTWILGVRDGRSYCGDGRSHIFDLKVNDVALGEAGSGGKISQLNLEHPGKVKVTFDVAARLEEKPTEADRAYPPCAARPEALLAHRAGPHRRLAEGAGGGDRQRPAGRPQRDRRGRLDAADDLRGRSGEFELDRRADLPLGPHESRSSSRLAGNRSGPAGKVPSGAARRSTSVGIPRSAAFASENGRRPKRRTMPREIITIECGLKASRNEVQISNDGMTNEAEAPMTRQIRSTNRE